MTNAEIENLITEYNQAEQEQQNRLEALLLAMRARRGYREIVFTGERWTVNQFQPDTPERIAIARIVGAIQRFITGWNLGEE